MKFFGGVLKFVSVIIIIVSSVLCPIICMDAEWMAIACVVMGVCWLFSLIVAMSIWFTGAGLGEIAKLRKKVAYLEQKVYGYSGDLGAAVPAEPVRPAAPVPPAAPVEQTPVTPVPPYAAKKQKKSWVPAVIVGCAALVIVAAVALVFALGGKNSKPQVNKPSDNQYTPVLTVPAAEQEDEPNAAPSAAEEVYLGGTISTGFVDMMFYDFTVQADIKNSVTIDHVTRITGPDPLPGQQYMLLTGTIVNTSHEALPVYDFFLGKFEVDGYTYEVTANDCDILTPDGSTVSSIDPLMEYEIRIYTAIPDAMAEAAAKELNFTFGFYDGFDNHELSYNRSFEENPIALCPYQYQLKF